MVFLLHGFQGLPLPGSGVARQGLCDDDDKGWRDHEEGSYIEVQQSCHCLFTLVCAFNKHLLTLFPAANKAQLTQRKH